MSHNICAIIGKDHIDKEKIQELGLAVAFESGYSIIILDQELMSYWDKELNLNPDPEEGKVEWAGELSFYFASQVGLTTYAIIQTDYFGGIGEQYANLYDNGEELLHETSINTALQRLGVKCLDGKDEFETLNLGEYRASEFYYWSKNNWADQRDNMIPGRVPNAY